MPDKRKLHCRQAAKRLG